MLSFFTSADRAGGLGALVLRAGYTGSLDCSVKGVVFKWLSFGSLYILVQMRALISSPPFWEQKFQPATVPHKRTGDCGV